MLGHFVTDALAVVFVLGIMIFIHEAGHFVAAKAFGVRVLVFSLGFGKTLLHFTRGETDYRISVLPFGGYVKMAGDDPSEDRSGDPGEFLSQSRWHRFVIVVMGPVMNILLAVVLLTGLHKYHSESAAYLEGVARVGDVEPSSPAAQANVHPGDSIRRLGNVSDPKWEDIELRVATTVNETIPVELERDGQRVSTSITPVAKGSDRLGYAGWDPIIPALVGSVEDGLPASKAGIKPGDQIVGIDGRKVYYSPGIASDLQTSQGKPVVFDVLRAGKEMQITVQPVYSEVMGEKRWRIGVGFHNDVVIRQLPWLEAFKASIDDNVREVTTTFSVLGKIITKRMSPRTLSGPIGIARISGEAYRSGIVSLLSVMAMISLQLGIFNLLPIPVLDGGMIALLLVEGLMRRELSLQVKERFLQVGIAFLLLLVGFCVYNDLLKTFRPG